MTLRARRGVALALMLFALVAIAAIAQAIVAPAIASHRAALRLTSQHAAESAVERTLATMVGSMRLADWDSGAVDTTPRSHTLTGVDRGAELTITTQVRPVSVRVFSFGAIASLPLQQAPAAVRRTVLAERRTDTLTRVAAVTAGGDIALAADAAIEPDDTCPEDAKAEPTILTSPGSDITGGQATDGWIRRDAAASDPATYASPGGLDVARISDLVSASLPPGAVVSPAPVASVGSCVHLATNWGAASPGSDDHPCADHAPVIAAAGDLTITGGEGQGVLLVAGRLTISGPFHYEGMIIASGGMETSGAVVVIGGIFTAPTAPATLGPGGAIVRSSSCALAPALDATARVHLVPNRWWWR